MSHSYLLSIDSLKKGDKKRFTLILSPELFQLDEPELRFQNEVHAAGEAYLLQDGDLMLHFDAKTIAEMPCAICNRMSSVSLEVREVYHLVAMANYSDAFFDLRPIFREELLLEIPQRTECEGFCPERSSLTPYLRSREPPSQHFPFSKL